MFLEHTSPWYFNVFCVFIGLLYSFLLYKGNQNFNKWIISILFFVRFSFVAFLSYLLLSPFINSIEKRIEKPIVVLLQDASSSIKENISNEFGIIKDNLKNYDVHTYHFSDKLYEGLSDSNDGVFTNFSKVLDDLNSTYYDRNLSSVIIASDGLYNKGLNPIYSKDFNFSINTILQGDTLIQPDLCIDKVEHNDITFLDNKFPVKIRVKAQSAIDQRINIKIKKNNKIIFSDFINCKTDLDFFEFNHFIKATSKGVNKYRVELSELLNEKNIINNYFDFYIDVIDSKSRVLILNDSPHPDVNSLVSVISSNKNIEFKISKTAGFSDAFSDFNLVVIHSINSLSEDMIYNIYQSTVPLLIFCTNDFTNLNSFINSVEFLKKGSLDEVFPSINSSFDKFNISDSLKKMIELMPPLITPFGSYSTINSASILINQKIGSLNTSNPIICFEDGNQKVGVVFGEGFWKWRLRNFYLYEKHDLFNTLFNKVIQYLAIESDKSKLRLEFDKLVDQNKEFVIKAEFYNDNYELYNDNLIELELYNSAGDVFKYNFDKNDKSYSLNLGTLLPDNYSFKVIVSGSDLIKTGVFNVQNIQIEDVNLIADYNFLKNLSSSNNGDIYLLDDINVLINDMLLTGDKKIIKLTNKQFQIIDLTWILFFLLFYIFIEWFIRKYNGLI